MSDLTPKSSPTRKTGLSPKEQKLQALRDKLVKTSTGAKPTPATGTTAGFQGKGTLAGKKTAFQRKAT
jgi:hypothetical protein